MGKSIKVNYFLNMSYQVLVLLVPIVTTPYIARTLGAEGIGIYSYTYSVVSCFVLAAVMGTTSYAQRTIAYYQNDVVERSRKFFDVFSFRLVTTLLCSAVYCVYLASGFCKYKVPALVQMLYLVAVAADVSWLFQGMEEFKKIVVRDTLTKLLNVFLLFLMVKSPNDVVVYTGILGGMTLLGNLSVWPYVPRLVCAIPMREWRPFKDVREIFLLFIPTIAIQLYSVLDKMMIGAFSPSAAENGYYEQTEKVVRVALMVVTSLGTVVAPRIAQLYHKQDEAGIKSYLKKSFQFVWLLGVPIMCGLIGFAHLFVPVFYGPGYEKIEILMPIYSCVVVAVSISNVVGVQYLIPTKQQNGTGGGSTLRMLSIGASLDGGTMRRTRSPQMVQITGSATLPQPLFLRPCMKDSGNIPMTASVSGRLHAITIPVRRGTPPASGPVTWQPNSTRENGYLGRLD